MYFPIFYGSVRSERQGIKAARYLEKQIKERGNKAAASFLDELEWYGKALGDAKNKYGTPF